MHTFEKINMPKIQTVNLVCDRTPIKIMVSPRSLSRSQSRCQSRNQSRSISPQNRARPWIPAPCKTSKNAHTWNGQRGMLNASSIRYEDDIDYDDEVHFRQAQSPEKEIEVLKDELNQSLNASAMKERELNDMHDDLYLTELENTRLKSDLKNKKAQNRDQLLEQCKIQSERQSLLNRLVEAEAEAVSTKREMALLRSALNQLQNQKKLHPPTRTVSCEKVGKRTGSDRTILVSDGNEMDDIPDQRMSSSRIDRRKGGDKVDDRMSERMDEKNNDTHPAHPTITPTKLQEQVDILIAKCADAEASNTALRKELEKNKKNEAEIERLAKADAENISLQKSLAEMDSQIDMLTRQVDKEREDAETYRSLQRNMELRRNKAECMLLESEDVNARLKLRMESTRDQLDSEKKAHSHTKGLLSGIKERTHNEKEQLREKLRTYRERALQSEEALEVLSTQLEKKRNEVAQLEDENAMLTTKLDTLVGQKTELLNTSHNLERKVHNCQERIREEQSDHKILTKELKEEIGRLSAKYMQLETHNRQLAAKLNSTKDMLEDKERELEEALNSLALTEKRSEMDLQNTKQKLKKTENLLREREEENSILESQFESTTKEKAKLQHETILKLEQLRGDYEEQLSDLKGLPEKLAACERRLRESEAAKDLLQNKYEEQTDTVTRLNSRVDSLTNQLVEVKEKFHEANEDNLEMTTFSQQTEKKLFEVEQHSRDLMDLLRKKDQAVEDHQARIDDLEAENESLTQQLETSVSGCKRQVDALQEKSHLKERTANARIEELEAQLNRVTTTTSQLKRLKEEAERRSQARINEMRERLEQANNTTRSMQNYVNFLKQSYSSVFGDSGYEGTMRQLSPRLQTPKSFLG